MMIAPTSPDKLDYELAFMYAITLSYNGYKDWRIPSDFECLIWDIRNHWNSIAFDIAVMTNKNFTNKLLTCVR